MSADHRKPVVAFVMLALAAAVVVGVQQAEARGSHILAAAVGAGGHVQGTVPIAERTLERGEYARLTDLGPAFPSLHEAVGNAVVAVAPLDRVVATPVPLRTTRDRRTASGSADEPTTGPRPASATIPAREPGRRTAHVPSTKPGAKSATTASGRRAAAPARRTTPPRSRRAGSPSGPASRAWTGEHGPSGKAVVHRAASGKPGKSKGKGKGPRVHHAPDRPGRATAPGHR